MIKVLLFLSFFLLLPGCLKPEETVKAVRADAWLHQKIPARLCGDPKSELWNYGIYRKVNCTPQHVASGVCKPDQETYEEFIPYCSAALKKYGAMHEDDQLKWIEVLRVEFQNCN